MQGLRFSSPLGDVFCAVDDAGALVRLDFLAYKKEIEVAGDSTRAEHVARQVNEYFAGTRQSFDVPLAPPGTAAPVSWINSTGLRPFKGRSTMRLLSTSPPMLVLCVSTCVVLAST